MREVVASVDEHGAVPRAEKDARGDGPGPVDRGGITRPREPQLAQGDADARDTYDAHHGFGRGFAVFVFGVRVDHLPDQTGGADYYHAPDADAGKREPADADGPAAQVGEDDGVGDEAEVEDAVDYTDLLPHLAMNTYRMEQGEKISD